MSFPSLVGVMWVNLKTVLIGQFLPYQNDSHTVELLAEHSFQRHIICRGTNKDYKVARYRRLRLSNANRMKNVKIFFGFLRM